jgi:hypothetical protein
LKPLSGHVSWEGEATHGLTQKRVPESLRKIGQNRALYRQIELLPITGIPGAASLGHSAFHGSTEEPSVDSAPGGSHHRIRHRHLRSDQYRGFSQDRRTLLVVPGWSVFFVVEASRAKGGPGVHAFGAQTVIAGTIVEADRGKLGNALARPDNRTRHRPICSPRPVCMAALHLLLISTLAIGLDLINALTNP